MNFEKGEWPVPLCLRCRHRLPWGTWGYGIHASKKDGYCELREIENYPRCAYDNEWCNFEPDDRKEDRTAIIREWKSFCDWDMASNNPTWK